MAINKITGKSIKDVDISASDLAPGTITSDKIAPGTIAADRLAGSITNAKLSNSAITINGTSIALGASGEIVAGTDWQAITVADGSTALTTEAGKGYFLDTNAGVIEATLPASVSRGDTILLVDYSGTFATNKLIINLRGHKIDSTEGTDVQVTANNSIVELVYVDANKGWLVKINEAAGTTPTTALTGFNSSYNNPQPTFVTATGGTVTTLNNHKIHAFTGDGNFVVSDAGEAHVDSAKVEYLVIAGGGGGGKYQQGVIFGAGGGAGGFRLSAGNNTADASYTTPPLGACVAAMPVTAQTYPITVGAGGSANASGSNSIFSTITSAGGGHGSGAGQSGAAGGGGGGGEAGNTPPVSPPQGFPGGTGAGGPPGARGANVEILATGGVAGSGSPSDFPSGKRYYAGAGQGGPGQPGAAGPEGGGGQGGNPGNGHDGTAGTANTGSGGGGGGRGNHPMTINGSAGGKGVVILRYRFQLS